MHHEGGGLPGGGWGRGGVHVEGCEAAGIGFGCLVWKEEFGLEIVQTLLQQQGTCLLVYRQTQRGLEFRNICFILFEVNIWCADVESEQKPGQLILK